MMLSRVAVLHILALFEPEPNPPNHRTHDQREHGVAVRAVKSDMQTYCDRCNEAADHPIGITSVAELADLARDLGYRNVCPGCYDDLLIEAAEARQHQTDDRRSERRVASHVPVRILPASGGDPLETTTEDISEGGTQIRTHARLDVGAVVRVETADGSADAMALVEVVWHDGELLRAGLRLVEPSDSWTELVRSLDNGPVE